MTARDDPTETPRYYVTEGLVEYLLDYAREREPERVTVSLAITKAGDLDLSGLDDGAADLSSETPVFTHFYMPQAGSSVNAVFGMDLGTPVGQTQGRFVSHPTGDLAVDKTDDLHEVVFVAIPPWDRESLAAFDRSGQRLDLRVLDVEPPEDVL